MTMKNLLRGLRLKEVSLVDRGMNKDAKVVLFKRDDTLDRLTDEVVKSYDSPKEDFFEALGDMMELEREYEVREKVGPLMSALRESMEEVARKYKGEEFTRKARAQVENFMAEVDKVMNAGSDDSNDSGRESDYNSGHSDMEKTAGASGTTSGTSEETMDIEALTKKLEDLEASEASLTKMNEALISALESAGFSIEKSDDGAVSVEKKADPEYVVIDGEKIEKGAVPDAVFKSLESQAARISKMEADAQEEALRKRAATEFPNLSGTDATRAALLKSVDGIEDEATRDAVMETLKGADEMARNAFAEIGKGGDGLPDDTSERLEAMAKQYVEDGKASNMVDARAAVSKSKEGRELRAAAAH